MSRLRQKRSMAAKFAAVLLASLTIFTTLIIIFHIQAVSPGLFGRTGESITQDMLVSVASMVGCAAAVALVLIFLLRRALKPLTELARAAEQGNMQSVAHLCRSKSEIGTVTRVFTELTNNLDVLKEEATKAVLEVSGGNMVFRIKNERLKGVFADIAASANGIIREFNACLDHITEPVVIIDSEMKVVYANHFIRRFTDTIGADIMGMHVNDYLRGDVAGHPATVTALRDKKPQLDVSIQLPLQKDMVYDLEFNCIPFANIKGEHCGALLLMTNHTSIREGQRKEERLNNYRHSRTEKLTNVIASAFGEGNLSLDIPKSPHTDESAEIADELDTIEEIVKKSTYVIKGYVDEMSSVLDKLSRKDFTGGITRDYSGDFSAIRASINKIAHNMNEFFRELALTGQEMRVSTETVSRAIVEMAESFNDQLSSMKAINNAVESIADEASQNLVIVQKATAISSSTKIDAQTGNAQMTDMLSAMNEIRKSSNTIAGVIKTVQDIAFQTNLLALNASVEAARAGEHGRGFAVVAEEVRNLAARSAKAVDESTALIQSSIEKVDIGSGIAEATAESLTKIMNAVSDIDSLIGEISSSSAKQTAAVENIEERIKEINKMIEEDTYIVTRNATATAEVAAHAGVMQKRIAEFELRDLNEMGL